jgi:hypothetical protein
MIGSHIAATFPSVDREANANIAPPESPSSGTALP